MSNKSAMCFCTAAFLSLQFNHGILHLYQIMWFSISQSVSKRNRLDIRYVLFNITDKRSLSSRNFYFILLELPCFHIVAEFLKTGILFHKFLKIRKLNKKMVPNLIFSSFLCTKLYIKVRKSISKWSKWEYLIYCKNQW